MLSTRFGLSIRWDGRYTVAITVPPAYDSALCGLCGNYDTIKGNDFMLSDGSVVSELLSHIESSFH